MMRPTTTGSGASTIVRSAPLLCTGVCAIVSACGNEVTVFPPGLEPLETNRAPAPAGTDEDPFPERLEMLEGENDTFAWVQARGFVHGSVAATWSAFQDPQVVADRRKVDEWSVMSNVETGFDVSFMIHNVVHDVITVIFDVTWRQSVVSGDRAEPTQVAIRFQKTFGTVFIDILRGSILVRQVDDQLTEIEMIEHIGAASGGTDNIKSYLGDLFSSVVARVHGQPLPQY